MNKRHFFHRSKSIVSLGMVVSTITLIGFVAFRFLDAQDNTEIATTAPDSSKIASIETPEDVTTVTQNLDTAEIESLDSDLDEEFNF